LTLPTANSFVGALHRHHAPIPPGFPWFCIGAIDDESTARLCGVAIAGRPTNRNNDDGQTVEVLRVATDGTRNACSILLASCGRAAKAIGAWRCITYTLEEESGASLRAVGWQRQADGIKSGWHQGSSRTRAVLREHMDSAKVRWAVEFSDGPAPTFTNTWTPANAGGQQGVLL
jgi:hypothetical protein